MKKLISILVGFNLVLLSTPIVSANADDSSPSDVSVTEVSLSVAGIDEAIALSAGNRIVIKDGYKILVDGQTGVEITRVRFRLGFPQFGIVPLNSVSGNCGTSYFYLQNLGGKKYQFSTGFDLSVGKAADFKWSLSIRSEWTYPNSGAYNHEWSDNGPFLRSTANWTSGWKVDRTSAPFGALHVGRVLNGTVFRSDGVICTSGYPTSSANIT